MGTCCNPQRSTDTTNQTTKNVSHFGHELERLAALASDQLSMVGLGGGKFLMGSDSPEAYAADHEGPVREVTVAPFAIGTTTVTNADFAAFVLETGYITDAEVHGDSLVFAGLLSDRLGDISPAVQDTPWWRQVAGANWLFPYGDTFSAVELAQHPVTHVSQSDAIAYADWAGGRLLTETEWEFAARGGLKQQPFPWGSIREPDGVARMNTFVGTFPEKPEGSVGTVPVTSFAPNGYGLYNMTGNVWEWTASKFTSGNESGVLRGGSYLCHASYCRRYRTSARTWATPDTSLGHTGFRLGLTTG